MKAVRLISKSSALVMGLAALTSCGSSLSDVTDPGTNTLLTVYSLATIGTQYGDSSRFIGLNDQGELIGQVWNGATPKNVLVKHGASVDLGTCQPTAINNSGLVACSDGSTWTAAGRTQILSPTGTFQPGTLAMNDAGQMAGDLVAVGGATPNCGTDCTFLYFAAGDTAIVNGRTGPDGSTLAGPPVPRLNIPTDLVYITSHSHTAPVITVASPHGVKFSLSCGGIDATARFLAIGGEDELVGEWGGLAFTCKDNVLHNIGPGVANDISRKGLVVGTNGAQGFIYDGTSFQYVDDALATPGYTVISADLVNDAGQIVGMAKNTVTGQVVQVLLSAQ